MSSEGGGPKSDNRRRGRGGGGGRGRGKGGRRGRGGGRGRGGREQATTDNENTEVQPTTTAEPTIIPPPAVALKPIPPEDGDSWFITALKNLGHPEPSSVEKAMEVEEDPSTADGQLVRLTMWLEDRLIRSWKLEERRNLRFDYWKNINNYLDALECPEDYFPEYYYADDDKETPHWRYSSSHRQRIVFWLISNATSEAYGDISPPTQVEADPSPAAVLPEHRLTAAAAAVTDNKRTETKRVEIGETKEAEGPVQYNPFPLGFSTGDDQVDHILSLLRMKLLIQLEEDQKAVNEAVCQVQSVTSGKAKPLKQAKLRPNNIKAPPPERRGGGRGGRGGGRRGGGGRGGGGRGRRR